MRLFPPLKPKLSAALRDVTSKDPRMRAAAAEALGGAPPERADEARAALRPLIDDTVATVRGAAIASLGQLKDVASLGDVVARFEDGDAVVRQVAVLAAGDIGDRGAVAPLKRMLRRDEPELRFQAVAALAQLAPDEAVTPLSKLVDDADPMVREHLADALGSLEDPAAEPALATLVDDEASRVRQAAAIALARTGNAAGAEALIDAIVDPERAFEACWAIGELGVQEAREPLARLATAFFKPLTLKAAAAAALVRLDDPRGLPALRGVLTAFRSDARGYAAQLVGELGLEVLRPELEKLTRNPRGADPAVVAEALAKLDAAPR